MAPLDSGISDYSRELLNELKKYFDTTVWIDKDYIPKNINSVKIRNYKYFKKGKDIPVVYNIGNSQEHAYMYRFLKRNKGIIILHDSFLKGLALSIKKRFRDLFFPLPLFILNLKIGLLLISFFLKRKTDFLRLYFRKIKKNFKSRKKRFLSFGWNNLEYDKKGVFRWTKTKTFLFINEDIREIAFKVYSEFFSFVLFFVNKKKYFLKIPSDKYREITLKVNFFDRTPIKIFVFKPLRFYSKIIHKDKRQLGIKIYEIKYKTAAGKKRKIYLRNKYIFSSCFHINEELVDKKEKSLIKKIKKLRRKKENFIKDLIGREIVNSARGIVVHNKKGWNFVRKINANIPIFLMNHGINIPCFLKDKNKTKKELALLGCDFIICSFGKIQKHKNIERALLGFKEFSQKNKKSLYVIIGKKDITFNLDNFIQKHKLENKVRLTGYLSMKKAMKYIYVSDAFINLRNFSTGATSGSLIRAMSAGAPCVINDLLENKLIPSDCVIKIKRSKNEIKELKKTLFFLKNNPGKRKKISFNAKDYIKNNHLWKNKALELKKFIYQIYYGKNSNY